MLIITLFALVVSLQAQLHRTKPGHSVQLKPQPSALSGDRQVYDQNLYQDFEAYTNFTLSFSPWATNDMDGYNTYGIDGYAFLNSGQPMAYIAFNPSQTTPSLGADAALAPHSGSKFAASFAALTPPNNDWLFTPQINLGANGHLKFWVKSYTAQYGLERYKVGVSTTNINPASFTFISQAPYLEAPSTAWTQVDFDLSAYSGQQIYIGIQCVSNDAFIFMLDDVEVTSDPASGATLMGKVTDAVNGNPIANALVSVAGLSDYTNSNGDYSISNIPVGTLNAEFQGNPTSGQAPLLVQFSDLSTAGTHTVTASATGYTNYSNNQVEIPEGGTLELQISLSPTLAIGQMRFVLTWGELPNDLDSHLKTPLIEGSTYHVYYSDKGSSDSAPYVLLDIDDVTSYGPETTTIYDLFTGEYHYYIYNYSQSPEITTSGAVVQIFNDNGLLYTLNVPTSGTGLYWDICTLNGSTGNISIINQITDTEPGGGLPTLMPEKKLTEPSAAVRNIVSWNWTFGDGATSTLQNPSHTYTVDGSYNVSLTVSDGTSNNTKTKNQYINVGGGGGTSTLNGLVKDAVTGDPIANALVSVSGLSDYSDANGNYSITGIPAGTLAADFTADTLTGNIPLPVQFSDLSAEGVHLLTATADGYTDYSNDHLVIPDGGTIEQQINMSPLLGNARLRFVLTWGEFPDDLDSHLKTPLIEGSTYHVFYNEKGSSDSAPYALLDIDDTESYGPETTTIYDLFPGEYHYYIYNYTGEPEIATSQAVVQIFNQSGQSYSLNIPTSGTGLYWDVCTLNGSTGEITIINRITEDEPGAFMPVLMPEKKKGSVVENERNINSWSWSFGDGGSSSLQNPSHVYTTEGSYTVSLTVSNGVTNKTMTKEAYIRTGIYGVPEASWEKGVKIYPNPVSDQLNFKSNILMKSIKIYDLNGREVMNQLVGSHNLVLPLMNLKNGYYMLQIETEKGTMQRKLNVNK